MSSFWCWHRTWQTTRSKDSMNTWRTYTDLTTQNGRKTDAAIDVVKKMLGKRTVLTWFRKRKKSSFGRKLRTIYTAKVKTSLRTRWVPKINRLIVTNEEKIRQTVNQKWKETARRARFYLQSMSLVSTFSSSQVVVRPEHPPCCSIMCSFTLVSVFLLFIPLPHEIDHSDHAL